MPYTCLVRPPRLACKLDGFAFIRDFSHLGVVALGSNMCQVGASVEEQHLTRDAAKRDTLERVHLWILARPHPCNEEVDQQRKEKMLGTNSTKNLESRRFAILCN